MSREELAHTQRSASDHIGSAVQLEARLLGGCALRCDGRPLPDAAFRRRRSLTLLLFLLSVPGHRAPREQVLELLWPEQDPEESERGLRVLLADLRATLGGSATIAGRGPVIGFGPALALSLDAATFETAARQALAQPERDALQRAAALYTGPYLPERAAEPWALARRTHLGQLHEQVLARLTDHEEESDPLAAERRLRALLHSDPTAEPTARRLMAALDRQGRHAEALAVFDALATALATQLGLAPTAETVALRDRLYGAQPAPAGSAQQTASGSERPGPAAALQPQQTNLPAPLTSFIGRERELAELGQLLRQPPTACRMVTLTGAGGCGKTRLAIEVARTLVPHFPDGVWLVELATLTDPALVPQALATVLGVQERAQAAESQTLTDLVLQALRGHRALVLLDNCEHLRAATAALATALVRACPQVQVLATSRQALGIIGEVTWLVPSLATPPAPNGRGGAPVAPAELARFGAVRLFLERARASRPGFTLTESNAAPVAQVCRRLDGIPLAIELAAAQLRALHIHDLAGRLDDRFRLLSTGSRAALPRHRTLQAVMDWSYSLLDEPERVVLQRLSVFAGGCTPAAAAAVCAGDTVTTEEVEQYLSRLVGKSLLILDEQRGQGDATATRYRLLETVRQYAHDRLDETGQAHRIQDLHAAWCLALAEHTKPALAGTEQITALGRLEADHDNLRAALQRSFATSERAEEAVRYVVALDSFWEIHGHWSEARRWLAQALALRDRLSLPLQCAMLSAAGTFALDQGDLDRAVVLFSEVLVLQRELGDQSGVASALHKLAVAHQDRGAYDQASALYGESLPLKRTLGDTAGIAAILNSLGVLANNRERYEEAVRWFTESQSLWRGLGDTLKLAYSLNNIGVTWRRQGNLAAAMSNYEESLQLFRQLGEHWGIAAALNNMGLVARLQGEYARAATLYRESLPLWRDLGDQRGIAGSLEEWADLAGRAGAPDRAVRLFSAADALRAAISAPISPADLTMHAPVLAAARATIGEEAFARLWAEGQAMTTEQAIAEAIADMPVTGAVTVT